MAEDGTASNAEFQAWRGRTRRYSQWAKDMRQLSERVGPWLQKIAILKEPEDVLRLERERLLSETKLAKSEAESCFQSVSYPLIATPDHHDRLRVANERVTISCTKLEAFDKDYTCLEKLLQNNFVRQAKDIEASAPRLDYPTLQDALLHLSQLRAPTPGSPSPASTLPSDSSGGGSCRFTSPESEPRAGGPEQAAGYAHTSTAEGDNANAAGTFTATGCVASSFANEQVTVS